MWCCTLATCECCIRAACPVLDCSRREAMSCINRLTGRFLFCVLDFLVGGAIGYIATYFAVRRLYGSIRVD